MKIVMINGSPRANGSTAQIMRIMQNKLQEKENVEVDFYNLSELELNYCSGCYFCFKTAKCKINDDLEELAQVLAHANGVIIGSPTYASNVSGQLKTFIDRGHLIVEQSLYRKYAIGIITSENYGGSAAASVLRNVFSFSGAYVTSMVQHKLPFSNLPKFSPKTRKKFERKAERLYKDIKGSRRYFLQKLVHNFVFYVGLKLFVLKKGNQYQGVIENWKRLSLLR